MTRPVLACGLARVHIYDRDGVTPRGTLSGANLTATHAKTVDGSSVSFSANALEPAMVTDPSMLDDALCVVELDVGGVWTPIGTPYVLAPGSGTVIGAAEGAAREFQPVGVGAAQGLCGEWLVLHSGGVVNRRGPTERYIGWQSLGFTPSMFNAADLVDPADLDIFAAKYGEPYAWPTVADLAQWAYRDASHGDPGALTLFIFGEFEVTVRQKYIIGFSCDEEADVFLDGPGQGGIILQTSEQETGYTIKNVWTGVLDVGFYKVSAAMTTVDTPGGDGFDAARMYVATVNNKGRADTVVLMSGEDTLVYRQSKSDVRPGFTCDVVAEILRDENETWGIPSAALMSVTAGDELPDGEERVWSVGTTVAQCLSDMEVDVSWDVTTSYVLTAWGTDPATVSATLEAGARPATAGMNIDGEGYTSDAPGGTRAVVLTNDGFVEVIDDDAEDGFPARGMYLESGASGSIGKGRQYALDAIRQGGRVRRSYQVNVVGVAGAIPEVDFTVRHLVTAPDYLKAPTDLRVLSVTLTNQAAHVGFTVEGGED